MGFVPYAYDTGPFPFVLRLGHSTLVFTI